MYRTHARSGAISAAGPLAGARRAALAWLIAAAPLAPAAVFAAAPAAAPATAPAGTPTALAAAPAVALSTAPAVQEQAKPAARPAAKNAPRRPAKARQRKAVKEDSAPAPAVALAAAPALAEPPVAAAGDSWHIALADRTLNGALSRWAAAAGWQLLWELPVDYAVQAHTTIPGKFEDAVALVVTSMEHAEIPMKAAFYQGNKVLRITAKGAQ